MSPNPINPEAGHHPLPTDAREMEASVRAGRRCWDELPYFDQRWGERGWRFTMSDGGWLATLAYLEAQAEVNAKLDWLARILGSRGMPSVLIERHLLYIYDELLALGIQARADCYSRLRAGAEHLASRRRQRLPDHHADAIAARFASEAVTIDGVHLPGMGPLITCAVVDRANGIRKAVDSLTEWLADPVRFPSRWCGAVHSAIQAAEESLVP